jgi:hypothetical protein
VLEEGYTSSAHTIVNRGVGNAACASDSIFLSTFDPAWAYSNRETYSEDKLAVPCLLRAAAIRVRNARTDIPTA